MVESKHGQCQYEYQLSKLYTVEFRHSGNPIYDPVLMKGVNVYHF